MEINKKQLGRRIKDIRLNKCKFTMEEFGKEVGSGKSNVSRWERGENVPNDLTLKKIAELGDMSVDELLYGNPREYVYNFINDEINNYSSKLWFTMSNYVKNKYDITDEEETKEKISELINEQFDSIYSDIEILLLLKRANTKAINASVYSSEELIINKTINYFAVNEDISFKEYKEMVMHAVDSLPTYRSNQSVDQLTNTFINKGYSEEISKQKALDRFFMNKAHDSIDELKKSMKNLYEEYLKEEN